MKHSVGKTIASLRKKKKMTQAELANLLNVSDKAVSKWESENGMPEITLFPKLAEIFEVSIDYLMTGKEAEEEIITMSKIELCAKKDDPELLGDFSAGSKDETGRSLMDYIRKYDSLKVLKALFDRCSHQTHYMGLFGHQWGKDVNAADYLMLVEINRERKYIQEVTRAKTIYAISDIEKSGYLSIIKYLITNYQKLPTDQKEYYFGKENVLKPNTAWIHAYPYFLQEAYAQGKKETFNELLDKIVATNSKYRIDEKEYQSVHGYNKTAYDHAMFYEHHIYIYVLRNTVEAAYSNGNIDLGDQLNEMCKTPLSNYEKKVIAVDNDKTLSADEKQLQKAIHDGVVCIDELVATKNYKLIAKQIKENPIHTIEWIVSMFEKKQYRQLFQFAVDQNLRLTADFLAQGMCKENNNGYVFSDSVDREIVSHFWRNSNEINSKYLFRQGSEYWGIIEIQNYIQERKAQILNDISLKFDKEKTIGNLTREYFEKELAKGNTEMVIIKLCVRLEAILRSDYHYEGDFSEMLSKYCETFNTTDDEGNDYNPTTPRILHKLRMQRNSIVHSEKTKETLTMDEIRYCIDYICKIG